MELNTAGAALTVAAGELSAAAAALSAMSATGGGGGVGGLFGSLFGGGGGGSSMSGMFGEGTALAGYAVGTAYVPQDTLAVVHRGEAIIPAAQNRANMRGGNSNPAGPIEQHFHISGPVDTRTQGQIFAAAQRGLMSARARTM